MTANDVRVAIYRSFVKRGIPPTVGEVAVALGIFRSEVPAALRQLQDDDVIVLHPGTLKIWLAHPFTDPPGPFKVTSGDRTWDAICIWDALGILVVLGTDGEVTTACPDCSEPLTIRVEQGAAVAPAGYAVHYGVPAARWYEDIAYT